MLPLLIAATLFLPPNAPPDCAPGEVMTFNGTVYACTSALSTPCTKGATLRKLKDGSVACIEDQSPPMVTACPAGEAAIGVNAKGGITCAPPQPNLSCRAAASCAEGEFPLTGRKACCRFGGKGAPP